MEVAGSLALLFLWGWISSIFLLAIFGEAAAVCQATLYPEQCEWVCVVLFVCIFVCFLSRDAAWRSAVTERYVERD